MNKLRDILKKDDYTWKTSLIIFSILFSLIWLLILLTIKLNNLTLVRDSDSLAQHIHSFRYMGQWYRESIKNILQLRPIPQFEPVLNTGIDIIQTFSYYGIFDPINLISVIFPREYSLYGYSLSIILRNFLCGLSFLYLSRYFNLNMKYSILGALSYISSAFIFVTGFHHPFFISATIYLPLLIVAVDKVLKEDKINMLIFITFLSLITNVYFSYMDIFAAIIYFVIAYFTLSDKLSSSEFLKKSGLAVLGGIIALLLSMFVILPTFYSFFDSTRIFSQNKNHIEYLSSLEGLKWIFKTMTLPYGGYTYSVGVPIITFIMSFGVLFIKSSHTKFWRVSFIIVILALITPYTGWILNLFAYTTYRWTYMISLLICVAFTKTITEYTRLNKQSFIIIFLISLLASLSQIGATSNKYINILLIALSISVSIIIILSILINKDSTKLILRKLLVLSLVFPTLATNLIFILPTKLSPINLRNYEVLKKVIYENELSKIKTSSKFERVSPSDIDYYTSNIPLFFDKPSTYGFYSLTNKAYGNFILLTENSKSGILHRNYGFDGRIKINTFLSSKYISCETPLYECKDCEPTNINDSNMCINKYYLPLGLFYDKWYPEEDTNSLNGLQFEDRLLKATSLSEPESSVEKIDSFIDTTTKREIHSTSYENGIININLSIPEDKISYLRIVNATNSYQTSFGEINIDNHDDWDFFSFSYKNSNWPPSIENPVINLGYSDKERKNIKIKYKNNPDISNLRFLLETQDLTDFEELVEQKRINYVKSFEFNNNELLATVDSEKEGILVISIPYSQFGGWKAYIDNKEVPINKAQVGFMGLKINEGIQDIKLVYSTPGLRIGSYISFITFVLLIGTKYYKSKNKKI